MAYKTLIFGTDDLYPKLKPLYDAEVERGNLEIVAVVDDINALGGGLEKFPDFDRAIISSHGNFYSRLKQLESMSIPRDKILDGRVFQVPNLNFPRLLVERIAHGSFEKNSFKDMSCCIYPRVHSNGKATVKLGAKSYFSYAVIAGGGEISVGKYCAIATKNYFDFDHTRDHNHQTVSSYALARADWAVPKEFYLPRGNSKILIGNDVWIGRRCIFKAVNPAKPLVIGDGAVVAMDSVVVKNVPPYAIVGGNPAQIIKYRFEPHVVEALLRIKWWDWSLDKIHDNFKYFNDIEKFISLHDKGLSS